jgi:Rod binding domain-containing protein
MSPIGPATFNTTHQPDPPEKILDAAQQFEALLLGEILRAARESSGGSSDCALDYAEQQFATVMARSGGLGIAQLIVKGLEPHK